MTSESAVPSPMARTAPHAGRSVLITGAGSGLERESALLFAAEGASVVVTPSMDCARAPRTLLSQIDAADDAVVTGTSALSGARRGLAHRCEHSACTVLGIDLVALGSDPPTGSDNAVG
jgi:NAD(P)-dependent dehydrogenase (short-subunit alcohol dehydrogenase family)